MRSTGPGVLTLDAAPGPLALRTLGRTGLQVSPIGLGCSGFWGDRRFAEDKAAAVVRAALEGGVTLFDTGHNYSAFNAEPRLGRILRRYAGDFPRDGLVLSSKAGTLLARAPLLGRGGPSQDFSPDAIESSCLRSIANLGCGQLDIFQLHGITPEQLTDALLRRLQDMRARGLFRCLGINTHSARTMQRISAEPGLFDVALVDYNILQLDREPLLQAMDAAGIGILAGTVLAQGHLLPGRIHRVRSLADVWYFARAKLKPTGRELAAAARAMGPVLSQVDGLSAAQAAAAWVLRNPHVGACLIGTTRPDNLRTLLATDATRLGDADIARIRAAFGQLSCTPSH